MKVSKQAEDARLLCSATGAASALVIADRSHFVLKWHL